MLEVECVCVCVCTQVDRLTQHGQIRCGLDLALNIFTEVMFTVAQVKCGGWDDGREIKMEA